MIQKRIQNLQIFIKSHKNKERNPGEGTKLWMERRYNKHTRNKANDETKDVETCRIFTKIIRKRGAIHGDTVAGAGLQQQRRSTKTRGMQTGAKNTLTVLKCLFERGATMMC